MFRLRENISSLTALVLLIGSHQSRLATPAVSRQPASNFTMPPPGVSAAENLLRENEGYTGINLAVESLYVVGSVVIDELLDNWATYENEIPAAAP
jgi:purine nucleoside permease